MTHSAPAALWREQYLRTATQHTRTRATDQVSTLLASQGAVMLVALAAAFRL
jgi:hypothetical protein